MIRVFSIFCLAVAVAAFGGEYAIDLPEDGVSGRVVAIELSGENLSNLGGHTAWLRLYDAKGNVVPWALEKAIGGFSSYVIKETPITIDLVKKMEDGALEISFHAAADAALPDDAILRFNTNVRNFGQNVQMFGTEAGGEEHSLKTDGNAYIFDSSSNINVRKLDVKFIPGRCRQFRVRLTSANLERMKPERTVSVTKSGESESTTGKMTFIDEPFNIKSLELLSWQLEERKGKELSQPFSVPFEKVESERGKSVFLVKPGVAPVNRIQFSFEEDVYSRKATVRNRLGKGKERIVGDGVVRSIVVGGDGNQPPGSIIEASIALDEVTDGSLEVTFEDHDNPPLHLKGVLVSLPIFRLKFIAKADQFPLRLTAIPNAEEPVYDVASILSLGGDALNVKVVHPGKFSGEPVSAESASTGFPRWALYIAVGLAVVAMGLALAATMRKGTP